MGLRERQQGATEVNGPLKPLLGWPREGDLEELVHVGPEVGRHLRWNRNGARAHAHKDLANLVARKGLAAGEALERDDAERPVCRCARRRPCY